MPSLGKIKDASSKMMAHVRHPRKSHGSSGEENIPLSPGYSSASLYTNGSTQAIAYQPENGGGNQRPSRYSASSTHSLVSPPPSAGGGHRPQSFSFDNKHHSSSAINVVKIRPGQPHGPPPVPKHSLPLLDIDFDHVPFQHYTRVTDNEWSTSVLKSVALIIVLILCPFIVMLFVFLYMLCCYISSPKRKLNEVQKKELKQQFGIACFLTLTKDLVLTQLIMKQNEANVTAWYNNIIYSPMIFACFMLTAMLPVSAFSFASVVYEFGYDVDKKKGSESFDAFYRSNKTKDDIAQRMTQQIQFYEDKFPHLAFVKGSSDEPRFVKKSLSTTLLVIAVVLSITTVLGRVAVHIVQQLLTSSTTKGDGEGEEASLSIGVVVGLSTINSLIVSLVAAPYFVYVILWKMALLREWKRFNENEKNTHQTLVNGGPQGIAMWWKIRQTLKMFSNGASLSAMIGKAATIMTTVTVSLLSVYLLVVVLVVSVGTDNDAVIPAVLLDNLMLYGALLLIGTLTIKVDTEKKLSVDIIELKQLNISYELGHLMNLEQEAIDAEPGVKVKVRVIRGSLMLLQELTTHLKRSSDEKNTSIRMTIICLVWASLLFVSSTALAFRHLLLLP